MQNKSTPPAPNTVLLGARVDREVAARFAELATFHGRSVAAELRLAVAIFDVMATEFFVGSDAGRAELGSDEQVAEAKRRIAAEREELWKAAFAPRRLPVPESPQP